MSIWQTVTWDVARAGGFTAFGLLTFSVALGLALTLHLQSPRWPRIINNELHNFLTLLALIFTGIHILAVWVDPFTMFGWNEVFIPFVSHYRSLWMALGIIAFYIGIAIGISTWLRPYIGYKLWRNLHILTLLLYVLVVVHGIAAGSDTRTWWGSAIYVCSVLLVGTLLCIRLMKPVNAKSRAHPRLAVGLVIALAAGSFWALLGPFQPGWYAHANNVNVKASQSTAAPSPQVTFPQSFTGNLKGLLSQNGPDSNGNVTLQLDLRIINGPAGYVRVVLQGQTGREESDGITIIASRVMLASSSGQLLYAGPLSNFSGERGWNMTAMLTGTNNTNPLPVQMTVHVNTNGQATGTIIAGSAIPGGNPAGSDA